MGGAILIFAFAMSLVIKYVEKKITAREDAANEPNKIVENNIVREPE
jgi:hypothetical protein